MIWERVAQSRDFRCTSGIHKRAICKYVGGSVRLHKGSEHMAANLCTHADYSRIYTDFQIVEHVRSDYIKVEVPNQQAV